MIKFSTVAKLEGATMEAVSNKYIQAYFEDIRRLNIRDANAYPRVTEHLPQIIQLIQELVDQSIAYAVDGDVYYSVKDFADYGKLSAANRNNYKRVRVVEFPPPIPIQLRRKIPRILPSGKPQN